jgi:hypothetical protein
VVEAVWRAHGVDVTVSTKPLTPAQQIVADFAKWLGVKPVFVHMPPGKWFDGAGQNNVILLNAAASGMSNLWYLSGHEIAHATGLDQMKVSNRVWRYWYKLYQARYSKNHPYRRNYLNKYPQMHSLEGLAHMLGTFMTSRRFRERVAAMDRSLIYRMLTALRDWFRHAPMPPMAKKTLKELKKLRDKIRAEEQAGKRPKAGNPPPN